MTLSAEYHQRDNPHCPELAAIHDKPLTAVLDGQQRLTAFNIGLRGSMSRKPPYKWWNSWDAFPKRILALDLLASPDPDEEGSRYYFEFIDEGRVGVENDRLWFKVSNILGMVSGPAMLNWLMQHGLDQEQLSRSYETLDRLHRAVRVDQVVAYYEEKSQDIERVLNIFIRCNRGGTPLSYSNLLLSIAVSQWKNLDARREVYGLVDEMNKVRPGLLFNADLVLKAGLMLSDIASVGFKVRELHLRQHGSAGRELAEHSPCPDGNCGVGGQFRIRQPDNPSYKLPAAHCLLPLQERRSQGL